VYSLIGQSRYTTICHIFSTGIAPDILGALNKLFSILVSTFQRIGRTIKALQNPPLRTCTVRVLVPTDFFGTRYFLLLTPRVKALSPRTCKSTNPICRRRSTPRCHSKQPRSSTSSSELPLAARKTPVHRACRNSLSGRTLS